MPPLLSALAPAPPQDMELDPRRKAELSIPIVAYPETLWKKQYRVRNAFSKGCTRLDVWGVSYVMRLCV